MGLGLGIRKGHGAGIVIEMAVGFKWGFCFREGRLNRKREWMVWGGDGGDIIGRCTHDFPSRLMRFERPGRIHGS